MRWEDQIRAILEKRGMTVGRGRKIEKIGEGCVSDLEYESRNADRTRKLKTFIRNFTEPSVHISVI